MEKLLFFNVSLQIYRQAMNVPVNPFCNSFTATNIGDEIAFVNGRILYPGTVGTSLGDSRSWGGNERELYKGNIEIAFAGGGANPAVEIEQKFYTNL